MRKKIFSIVLFGAMCVGFTACENEAKIVLPSKNEDNTDDLHNAILERLYNGHEVVNLGLSSGTLWATCNIGAEKPEEYGNYFAWGEVKPKKTYDWSTYIYANGGYDENLNFEGIFLKYNTDSQYGTTDNKTTLEPEDDAASVNWGGIWRMPTKAEQKELYTECTWTWTSKNGKNGYEIKGKNGNSIFLPAAGYIMDMSLYGENFNSYYWSSSLDERIPDFASNLGFDPTEILDNDIYGCPQYYGLPIRPVCSPK